MTSGRYGLVLRQVGRLLNGGPVASLGTGQLLERFAANRDEAAFEALVNQHGPMVLGTCRRMLTNPHDVDDAFQATFLVLARRAGSIRDADRLGPWLHGVARRVASRSKALSARRNDHRRLASDEPADELPDALEASELRAAIDEELASLPDKYRAPLVLCYLEGLTHDEAAQKLRWPVGTVRSRLAGGRDRLRTRLTKRGLAPSSVVPALLPQASIPQALLTTTVRVATSAGTVPAHVATLAKGALIAMFWNKLKIVATVGLMAGLTAGGAGLAAQQGKDGAARAQVADKSVEPPAASDLTEKERLEKELAAEREKLKQLKLKIESMQEEWWKLKEAESKEASTRLAALETEGKRLQEDLQIAEKTIDILTIRLNRLNASTTQAKASVPEKPAAVDLAVREGLEKELTAAKKRVGEIQHLTDKAEVLWKEIVAQTDENDPKRDAGKIQTIKDLRSDLKKDLAATAKKAEELQFRLGKLGLSKNAEKKTAFERATDPLKATTAPGPSGRGGPGQGVKPGGENPPVANAKAPQPIIYSLLGKPTLFSVIGPGHDRVTMINSETQNRSTFRLAQPAQYLHPVALGNSVALSINGKDITRTAVFDRLTGRWSEHDWHGPVAEIRPWPDQFVQGMSDHPLIGFTELAPEIRRLVVFDSSNGSWNEQELREPVKDSLKVAPTINETMVVYFIGRFVYIYSSPAKKWSILEGKDRVWPVNWMQQTLDSHGRMAFNEADVIHLYDPKTGDWTHIDTKDEK